MVDPESAEDTATLTLKGADIPFARSPLDAPVVYADDIKGAFILNGVARLNLVELRIDPDDQTGKYQPVAVLMLPHAALVNWGRFFLTLAATQVPEKSDAEDSDAG